MRRQHPAVQADAARKKVLELKEKDRLAKEAIQRKLDKLEVKRQADAALLIQSVRRAQLASRQVAQKARERDAELAEKKRQKEEKARQRKAALAEKQRELAQRKANEVEDKRRNIAATHLQSAWRGQMVRHALRRSLERDRLEKKRQKELAASRKRMQELEAKQKAEAATKIQNARRGRVARAELSARREEKKAAALQSQRQAREDKLRRKEQEAAATKLQSTYRGHQGRMTADRRREDIDYTKYMTATFGVEQHVPVPKKSSGFRSEEQILHSKEQVATSVRRQRSGHSGPQKIPQGQRSGKAEQSANEDASSGSRRPSFNFIHKWEHSDADVQTETQVSRASDHIFGPSDIDSKGLDVTFGRPGRGFARASSSFPAEYRRPNTESQNLDATSWLPGHDLTMTSPLLPEAEYQAEMARRQRDRRIFRARLREAEQEERQKIRGAEKRDGLANLFSRLSARAEREKRIEEKALHDSVTVMYARKVEDMLDRSAIDSAITIQKHRRGQLARRRCVQAKQERQQIKEEEAIAKHAVYEAERALHLQKARELDRQKECQAARLKLQHMYMQRRTDAATKIQSVRRGQIARRVDLQRAQQAQRASEREKAWRVVQQLRQKQQEHAILTIQSTRRGQIGRRIARKERTIRDRIAKEKRLKREREAVAKKCMELQAQRREEAVIRIQRKFRVRKARREMVKKQKETEKKRYEQEVLRTLELRRIREGVREAGAQMHLSADLHMVREVYKQKEDDITKWLQEEEEVWKWCLEQEARYAALRQAAETGEESEVLAKQRREASMWKNTEILGPAAPEPLKRVANPPGPGMQKFSPHPELAHGLGSRLSQPGYPGQHMQMMPSPYSPYHQPRMASPSNQQSQERNMSPAGRATMAINQAGGAVGVAWHAAHAAQMERPPLDDYSTPLNYKVLQEEERRNIKGLLVLLKKQREEMTQQKFITGQVRHEFSMLRLLVTLGDEDQRCYNCDMGLATLQVLLQALERVISLVHETLHEEDTIEHRRAILKQLLELLAGASQVDPQAKEVADSLAGRLAETEVPEEQPEVPEEQEPPKPTLHVFDGYWAKEDSSSKYLVKGKELFWLDSGSVYEFSDHGGKRCAMDILGDTYKGRLIGKDCISWSDGSFWVRAESTT